MGSIKILDENLSNMIAAGEVVENPASLIKELLENSLDAKSDYIKIEVTSGGKNIKFFDNGKGMSREDLLLCIERHATSKISTKDDLFNLITYGFRGEALSAIAAVSKLSISTKQANDNVGNSITVLAGKITSLKEVQKSNGTDIEIKDLFYNTPARLKFLRKDSTENSKIKEIVLSEALANPNVSITLLIDNKEVLRTSGKGIENTLIDLFGLSTMKNLKKFDYGYMGNLTLTRSTKDFLFTFVNGRPIKSKVIDEAVIDGYYTYLMKGKYPFVVLNINIDPKDVDVNVHPSKKIVKFADENSIYHLIYNSIIDALSGNKSFSSYTFEKKEPINTLLKNDLNEFENLVPEKKFEPIKTESFSFDETFLKKPEVKVETKNKVKENTFSYDDQAPVHDIIKPENSNQVLPNSFVNDKNFNLDEKIPQTKEIKEVIEEKEVKPFKPSKRNFRVIGQLTDMFILTEENGNLIIYDQHIVHERILYDKLKKEYQDKKITSQNLLIPIKVNLSVKESQILKDNHSTFTDFGFDIDEYSNDVFLIRAIPSIKLTDSIENTFFSILKKLNKINSKNELIESMIISIACKASIKAHQKLSFDEMEQLLTDLHEVGQYTCPHGRPITMEITLNELEKGFKRK